MASGETKWTGDKPRKRRGNESPDDHAGESIHPVMPHSSEAEQGVLSSIMLSPDRTIGGVIEKIRAEFFYIPAHRTIFEEMVSIWNAGKGIDLITFTQRLRDRKLLDWVGGASFVTSLVNFVPTAANIGYYLGIVADKYFLRKAIDTGTEIIRQAYEAQDDVEGLVKDVEIRLFELTQRATTRQERRTIKQQVAGVIDNLGDPEKAFGISTGFPRLDRLVGGLAPAAKIVIAGATSSGKSSLAHNIADSLAVERSIPTAIFTFEMTDEQTVQRLIQTHSEVSARDIVRNEVDMFLGDSFTKAAARIGDSPLFVIDERLDVAGIRARCMQLKASNGLRVAIVDYLQIIPERKERGENRVDQLDRMSAETKQIAKQLGITVIELSQVTALEGGGSRTRGSSGIQNDADQLWVIETDADDQSKKTLVVAKQRDGDQGSIPFHFSKSITRFRERGEESKDQGLEEF